MVEVKKPYSFTVLDTSGNEVGVGLSDLFAGRRQLIVYHFMFDPSWDVGCVGCSLTGDSIGAVEHINARDTTLVCVSRAPIAKIEAFKKRMGWTFPWVSSYGSDFNYDFHATQDAAVAPVEYNFRDEAELEKRGQKYSATGEQPGVSCFIKGGAKEIGEPGKMYHTYSGYARALEKTSGYFGWMDMTLLGRQDEKNAPPVSARRDEYSPEELMGTAQSE